MRVSEPYTSVVNELPDPRDRSQPWWQDEPAYLAHYKAMGNFEDLTDGCHELIHAYSHAIPTLDALKLLATLSPLVELGAGGAYWARLLQDLGTDIVAYDPVDPKSNTWTAGLPPWTGVRPGDACTALSRNPERVPFACWPPRPYGYMSDVLRTHRGTLALITDGRLFGDKNYADPLYDVLESEWDLKQTAQLPGWPGHRDRLMIWHRK
jgi:hypothetical protein